MLPPNLKHQGQNEFNPTLEDTLECLKASFFAAPEDPPWPLSFPFHEKDNIGHGIVSVTIPESLPGHGLWPPNLWCKFELMATAMWSSWSILTVILMHLKGVAVFCKSAILLHLKALNEPTGSLYPLSVLLPSGSYG